MSTGVRILTVRDMHPLVTVKDAFGTDCTTSQYWAYEMLLHGLVTQDVSKENTVIAAAGTSAEDAIAAIKVLSELRRGESAVVYT
jgi:hypothetical protein